MSALPLSILAVLLLALALAMAAGLLLHQHAQRQTTAQVIQRALGENATPAHALPTNWPSCKAATGPRAGWKAAWAGCSWPMKTAASSSNAACRRCAPSSPC